MEWTDFIVGLIDPSEDLWDALWSFYDTDSSDSKDGRVFFTPNAYLGYNGTVNGINKWFDLNRADKTTGNIWTNQWHYVTVSLGKSDFGIYVDGKLVCDKSKYTLYAGSSYAALPRICLMSFHHQIGFILDTALSGVRLQHIWTMYEFTAGH